MHRLHQGTLTNMSSTNINSTAIYHIKKSQNYFCLNKKNDIFGKIFVTNSFTFFLLSRLNLREKHARHIADLKAYYETEIQELQSKLTEAAALQDHSPDKVMRRTNERLQDNCIKLEGALKSANRCVQE